MTNPEIGWLKLNTFSKLWNPQKKNTVQKIEYKKIGFDLKLSIIDKFQMVRFP
jgi:hypothetical protein